MYQLRYHAFAPTAMENLYLNAQPQPYLADLFDTRLVYDVDPEAIPRIVGTNRQDDDLEPTMVLLLDLS
jgi:hypothetical protein